MKNASVQPRPRKHKGRASNGEISNRRNNDQTALLHTLFEPHDRSTLHDPSYGRHFPRQRTQLSNHWAGIVSRGWAKVLACRLQVRLSCVLSFERSYAFGICPGRLRVAISDVQRASLIFPAQNHFFFLILLITSMTCVLSLTQMSIILSSQVMLSILFSILVFVPQGSSVHFGECPWPVFMSRS